MPDQPSLPPGQQLVAAGKWPLVGQRQPAGGAVPWSVSIDGCVDCPTVLTLDQLRALERVERRIDIHCVTRWSKLGVRMAGVSLADVLALSRPRPEARFVSFVAGGQHGHSTSLPLQQARALGTLLVLECEGEPLAPEHGGPVRVVVPRRYFYKSLKWLERIDLLVDDRLGTWEREAGYHNVADPWLQQRYMAPQLTKQQMRKIVAERNFAGKNLRSLAAGGHDLAGLSAEGAVLRDADFRRCNLSNARFDGANLSNAHFEEAVLRGASFAAADVEGANFAGADLRGADFHGASLVGATFCNEPSAAPSPRPARIDATTRFEPQALEQLMPRQQQFVRGCLAQ